MARKKRTKPPKARGSSERKKPSPQIFVLQLATARPGTDQQASGGLADDGEYLSSEFHFQVHQPGCRPVEYQSCVHSGHQSQSKEMLHRDGVPAGPPQVIPDIHQAPLKESCAQAVTSWPQGAGASSLSTGQVQRLFHQRVIHDPSSTCQSIEQVPSLVFQKRPSLGTFGTVCTMKTNHFVVNASDEGIALREFPLARHFQSSPNLRRGHKLGQGLETWYGYHRSIRHTQKGFLLNIDVSTKKFIEPLPVIDFIMQILQKRINNEPLCDSDHLKIKKALQGIKVQGTHELNMHKVYHVFGLSSQGAGELSFPVDDCGTEKTVEKYFKDTYDFSIKYAALPCLQVSNQERLHYLPMEVCKVAEGQRGSKLNEKQMAILLEGAWQHPRKRELDILKILNDIKWTDTKEFGIKVEKQLMSLSARVLPPPWLKFNAEGMETEFWPRVGIWNMMHTKMFNGGKVYNWICINFCRDVINSAAGKFCHELAIMCQISGIEYSVDPVFPLVTAKPEDVERVLKSCHQDVMTLLRPHGQKLDLLVAILPDNNGSLYGDLKRICETDIGLVSQCCLAKHVFERKRRYVANVALKINVKVGGRNTVLFDAFNKRLPCVGDTPTIIFGAHVIQPCDGNRYSPSITAVVASEDWPGVTYYGGSVSVQSPCQEFIQDLFNVQYDSKRGTTAGGMIRERLLYFMKVTGKKPQRIIFYRDGVSNGQLRKVLWHELSAIKKACSSLDPNYKPSVTYVVIQKRHRTRLFADNYYNLSTVRSGNVLPGTVVDSDICHPTEFDFYLCSHAATQGTSRPVHYHVLWDENKFDVDAFQCLTNYLCYTYARCTRAISVVPPIYYAQLLASRARCYMEPSVSEKQPMASGAMASCEAAGSVTRSRLRPIKDDLKRLMFYC